MNFLIFAIPGVIAALAVFIANKQGKKVITLTEQSLDAQAH